MKKRRSSLLTIAVVIAIFALIALLAIKIAKNVEERNNENDSEIGYEYTNYQEEDKMQYEYSKLDKSLNGIYAIGIVDNYIVGVKSYNSYINICQINPELSYDYSYYDGKLYIVQKDLGTLSIFDLKNLSYLDQESSLKPNVDSLKVVKDEIMYYISEGIYYKYENGTSTEVYSNVTSKNFVIKNEATYICIDNTLYKITNSEEGVEEKEQIDTNVEEIYYDNYYERDRIVYDKLIDETNISKNIYNLYNGKTSSIIRNNTYFALFGAKEYVYLSNDKQDVIHITKENTNEYIYRNKTKKQESNDVKNIVLFKDGHVLVVTDKEKTIIDLTSNTKIIIDNIMNLQNIKYLKQ